MRLEKLFLDRSRYFAILDVNPDIDAAYGSDRCCVPGDLVERSGFHLYCFTSDRWTVAVAK
jgi:hypothetical protein